jgi:hypothetical protein
VGGGAGGVARRALHAKPLPPASANLSREEESSAGFGSGCLVPKLPEIYLCLCTYSRVVGLTLEIVTLLKIEI